MSEERLAELYQVVKANATRSAFAVVKELQKLGFTNEEINEGVRTLLGP